MKFTKWVFIGTMKDMNLFDDIDYKYIKNIINDDEDEIKIEIKTMDCDRVAYCKTKFTFCIPQLIDQSFGEKFYRDMEFTVIKEYNGSSMFALMMINLEEDEEDEEEDEICKECGGYLNDDEDREECKMCDWGCPQFVKGWLETHPDEELPEDIRLAALKKEEEEDEEEEAAAMYACYKKSQKLSS